MGLDKSLANGLDIVRRDEAEKCQDRSQHTELILNLADTRSSSVLSLLVFIFALYQPLQE